jgi:hypothetical protein
MSVERMLEEALSKMLKLQGYSWVGNKQNSSVMHHPEHEK